MLSLGRIVHFKLPGGSVRPATATTAHNATCGNLSVALEAGDVDTEEKRCALRRTGSLLGGLLLVASATEGDREGEWRWPPHVGAAAAAVQRFKTEADAIREEAVACLVRPAPQPTVIEGAALPIPPGAESPRAEGGQ